MTTRTRPLTASGLLAGLLADAIEMAGSGFASAADIDTAMRLGAGHPLGPFAYLRELPDDERPAGAAVVAADATTSAPAEQAPPDVAYAGPIGVLGTGHMAAGIVECGAKADRDVLVLSRSERSSTRLRTAVEASLQRSVAKGRLDEASATAISTRVRCTTRVADLAGCALVIEAVAEDLEVKRAALAALEPVLAPGATVATNTSSFRVAEVTAGLGPGPAVLALHFFNPAPAMKLVEIVVPADATDRDETLAEATAFARSLGKTPVTCGDQRGFIVNRLLIPYLNDAVAEVRRGVTPEVVDGVMREQARHPMGPLALVDLIGVDVTVAALASMHESTGSERIAPDPALLAMLERGDLGRKTGRGFHDYS